MDCNAKLFKNKEHYIKVVARGTSASYKNVALQAPFTLSPKEKTNKKKGRGGLTKNITG